LAALAAAMAPEEPAAEAIAWGAVAFGPTCPIMRIFDEVKAREFYLGFLGMRLDWEARFTPDAPLYAQVSRAGLILHLSEHHGDATPGSTVFVATAGLRSYHAELAARPYRFYHPSIERRDWGLEMSVTDPFGNRIRFTEQRGLG